MNNMTIYCYGSGGLCAEGVSDITIKNGKIIGYFPKIEDSVGISVNNVDKENGIVVFKDVSNVHILDLRVEAKSCHE